MVAGVGGGGMQLALTTPGRQRHASLSRLGYEFGGQMLQEKVMGLQILFAAHMQRLWSGLAGELSGQRKQLPARW
jgi:hypothetical protein